jgi:hypothetical protein
LEVHNLSRGVNCSIWAEKEQVRSDPLLLLPSLSTIHILSLTPFLTSSTA